VLALEPPVLVPEQPVRDLEPPVRDPEPPEHVPEPRVLVLGRLAHGPEARDAPALPAHAPERVHAPAPVDGLEELATIRHRGRRGMLEAIR
jgi:hypothetical protein